MNNMLERMRSSILPLQYDPVYQRWLKMEIEIVSPGLVVEEQQLDNLETYQRWLSQHVIQVLVLFLFDNRIRIRI